MPVWLFGGLGRRTSAGWGAGRASSARPSSPGSGQPVHPYGLILTCHLVPCMCHRQLASSVGSAILVRDCTQGWAWKVLGGQSGQPKLITRPSLPDLGSEHSAQTGSTYYLNDADYLLRPTSAVLAIDVCRCLRGSLFPTARSVWSRCSSRSRRRRSRGRSKSSWTSLEDQTSSHSWT